MYCAVCSPGIRAGVVVLHYLGRRKVQHDNGELREVIVGGHEVQADDGELLEVVVVAQRVQEAAQWEAMEAARVLVAMVAAGEIDNSMAE